MKKKLLIIILTFALVIILPAVTLLAFHEEEDLSPGWHGKGADRFYVLQDGSRAEGYQTVDGMARCFDKKGRPAGQGWIEDSPDRTYYCEGDGKLATGWKYIEGKVRYFYKEGDREDMDPGVLAKDWTTPGQIRINSEGTVDGDRGLALAYGIDVLNKYGWSLESAYKYSSSLRFEEGADEHYGFTTSGCAIYGFKNGGGNCLAWSGTFCTMAKLLGYDCRQIWGTLTWKGVRPHAWTEIWIANDDEPHVYDPRKHDGEDMAGFDFRYGDKGTYKYDMDSKEYLKW